jgi:hypothetical protein
VSTTSTSTAAPAALRSIAAAATVLMSLMNLPFAFDDGGAGTPKPLAWLVTLLGVVGIVAAVGLLRKASWGPWSVTAVGVLNLAGGVAAFIRDQQGAGIGVGLSLIIITLGLACVRGRATRILVG